jgi:mRNA interferase HigB
MRLFGRDVLTKSLRKHPAARGWIATWIDDVEGAEWHSIRDVRLSYPSADGVSLPSGYVVTIFNVKGNEYRLLTYINYAAGAVDALELVTHAEYDKDRWKGQY